MLVTPAFAQSSPFGGDNMLVQLLPFILIFVIMYFLILRPQQKRAKEHQELVKNLRRGDTVITSGGLVGKVTKVVDDDQIEVEIADGVRIRQVRSMITGVRAKGEPVKDESRLELIAVSRDGQDRDAVHFQVEGDGDTAHGVRVLRSCHPQLLSRKDRCSAGPRGRSATLCSASISRADPTYCCRSTPMTCAGRSSRPCKMTSASFCGKRGWDRPVLLSSEAIP